MDKMKFFTITLICIGFIIKGVHVEDTDDIKKSVICNLCNCKIENTIDCENKNLTELFTETDWLTVKEPKNVIITGNTIQNLTAFPELNITILILSNNKIERIEYSAFRGLKNLELLDLSYNLLTFKTLRAEVFQGGFDPDNYEPLKNLKTLKLGYNDIHSLDADLFEHFPYLENLSLNSNPFTVLDHGSSVAISNIPHLKFLDLSKMELEALPELFLHGPRELETLNLSGNLFKTIPSELKSGLNLKVLNLDENPMISFGEKNSFPSLPHLTTLSISFMSTLKKIDRRSLSNLPSLEILMCTNNPHLSSFDEKALSRPGREDPLREEWPPIKQLYLHNNNLSTLSSSIVGRWDRVEVVDIRINPWTCDCSNQWILDTLMAIIMDKTPELARQVECSHPIEMLGREIFELKLKDKQLRCLDKYGNHPERDGPILIGLLVGLLLGIPLTLAVVLLYKRGCFGIFGHPGPADYSRAFYKRADLQDDMNI